MFVRMGNVQQKFEEGLHFLEVAQVMKRREDEIRVAQPAIAVIPVATSARLFRKARRQGCQYSAGVFEAVEFQGQSGADDLLLMQQRHRAVFDPDAPVAYCLFEKVVCDFDEVVFNAESPCEAKIELLRQRNRNFFAEIGQRHVGQQAERLSADVVAQMVTASYRMDGSLLPSRNWTAAHADGRNAPQRFDQTKECRRTIDASILIESWTEVGNLKRVPARRCDSGEQNIRVRKIALFGLDVGGRDRARNRKVPPIRIKQSTENRRAVRSRGTHPFDSAVQPDQRRSLTIADKTVRIHAVTIGDFSPEVNER